MASTAVTDPGYSLGQMASDCVPSWLRSVFRDRESMLRAQSGWFWALI